MSDFSFLSKVEDSFAITGRGVVLIPGVPIEEKNRFVKIGDWLEIRKPDGQRVITKVAGIEMGSRSPGIKSPLLLPRDVRKEDIPIGSELWHSPNNQET